MKKWILFLPLLFTGCQGAPAFAIDTLAPETAPGYVASGTHLPPGMAMMVAMLQKFKSCSSGTCATGHCERKP